MNPPNIGIDIPTFYFNGMALGLTNADVNLVISLNNEPIAQLQMSFTIAKTLQEHLSDAMSKLESATNQKIMTTVEIDQGIQSIRNI